MFAPKNWHCGSLQQLLPEFNLEALACGEFELPATCSSELALQYEHAHSTLGHAGRVGDATLTKQPNV